MEPTFHKGDMVFEEYIPNGAPLQFGKIGAFVVGNDSYIKENQPDGLHSHNEYYLVMRFDNDASVYLMFQTSVVVYENFASSSSNTLLYHNPRILFVTDHSGLSQIKASTS